MGRWPYRLAREVVLEHASTVYDHEDPIAHRHDPLVLGVVGNGRSGELGCRPDRVTREHVPKDGPGVHDDEDPVAHRHDPLVLRVEGDARGVPRRERGQADPTIPRNAFSVSMIPPTAMGPLMDCQPADIGRAEFPDVVHTHHDV